MNIEIEISGHEFPISFVIPEAVTFFSLTSHGHMDHIAGIGSHVSIRTLRGSKPKPTYYIPSHLKDPLVNVLEGFSAMTEEKLLDQVNLQTVDPGSEIKVNAWS